jgi:bacterial/archaeal transporter family protein
MWIFAGLISALLLGTYDILKKKSLIENAVLPVLMVAVIAGAIPFIFMLLFSRLVPDWAASQVWFIKPVSFQVHCLFFLKSVIVGASWVFTYYAMKHLPITIVSPIRASAPVWTILGAVVIFGERLNMLQWAGVLVVLLCYWLFSFAGRREGIEFRKNRWIIFIFIATLLGSISGLFDKYLVNHHPRWEMQAWFSIYLIVVLIPVLLIFWYPVRKTSTPFTWRWTIPLIGIMLILSDFIYFWALSEPGSMISLLTVIRRTSGIFAFTVGAMIFKEQNVKMKALVLSGIFIGILLIMVGSWK